MTFKEIFMEWRIRPEMYYTDRNKLLCFWYRGRKNRLGSRLALQVLRLPAAAVYGI